MRVFRRVMLKRREKKLFGHRHRHCDRLIVAIYICLVMSIDERFSSFVTYVEKIFFFYTTKKTKQKMTRNGICFFQ